MQEYQDLKIEDLISEDHLKELFKVKSSTVKRWRTKEGLPSVKLGNTYYVLEQDFMNWFTEKRGSETSK